MRIADLWIPKVLPLLRRLLRETVHHYQSAIRNPQSAIRNPQSLLSFNALRAGLDILQRVFSLLNFLLSFAADALVNFERRRQIGL